MPTKDKDTDTEIKPFMPELSILVSYDWYEDEFGDGFYPSLDIPDDNNTTNKMSQYHVDTLNFSYTRDKNIWKQTGGPNIDGLDGPEGEKFLKILNEKGNINATAVYNRNINRLFPK